MGSVKQKIAWLWQNVERILIVVFFLTFSLNIRKVFLTPYSFLNGGFNEYMTMSFSWADLLMIGTIIIYNIKLLISQFGRGETIDPLLENVIRNKSSVIRNYYCNNVSRETFYLLIFLGWIGLSVFWSQYRPIAIYRFLTLIEIALFAAVAIKKLRNNRWLRIAVFAVILNGLFQSLLGIAQFIHNSSLGLRFLGESIIGPNIDGVAKIIISSEKHIRAYGTFPHPNILAGFLLVSLFIIISELISRKLPFLRKNQTGLISRQVSHETFLSYFPSWILSTTLLLTLLGLGFTFSRSAFLGLFIGLTIFFAWIAFSWHSNKVSKIILKFLPLFILIIALAMIILISNTSFFSSQSIQERQLYQHVSYETISEHPVVGLGIGQFVLNEYNIYPKLESWQYQPAHNVYFLIFSELGIVGFILVLLYLVFLISTIRRDRRDKETYILTYGAYCCIVLSFLVISLFDHYFWDIKLGTFIFALPLIILSAEFRKEEN
jgi:O-antigen ligase